MSDIDENENNTWSGIIVILIVLVIIYYLLKYLGFYISYIIMSIGAVYFIYNYILKKNVVSWWNSKEKSKIKSNRINSSLIIGFGLLVFGITKLFFPLGACECAKLIAKNGLITYNDVKAYKEIGGSVYKDFKRTYDCTQRYDYDDLSECDIRDAFY